MIQHGVLPEERLKNNKYFRHQVMEYAKLVYGTQGGRKVSKGYWFSRSGSEKDINANYFQVETEYLFKALDRIEAHKFLNKVEKSKYNKMPSYSRRAVNDNKNVTHRALKEDLENGDDLAVGGASGNHVSRGAEIRQQDHESAPAVSQAQRGFP